MIFFISLFKLKTIQSPSLLLALRRSKKRRSLSMKHETQVDAHILFFSNIHTRRRETSTEVVSNEFYESVWIDSLARSTLAESYIYRHCTKVLCEGGWSRNEMWARNASVWWGASVVFLQSHNLTHIRSVSEAGRPLSCNPPVEFCVVLWCSALGWMTRGARSSVIGEKVLTRVASLSCAPVNFFFSWGFFVYVCKCLLDSAVLLFFSLDDENDICAATTRRALRPIRETNFRRRANCALLLFAGSSIKHFSQ